MDVNKIKINEAVKLLKENGYVVKKFTENMQKDSDKCESIGGDGDCLGCACSICIAQ